ncbi:gluconeogenesis factor YvcK family protein [Aureibacillus halotolerans]|uniref:Gluconeogenesis factor n=1 Tax=Aureibacillus halotolerans TaxID=1508390 RepID=A0A4R6TTI4_9BACI|nr:YvcK family protein [Aureibacillus halotolerans]TDQ36980.1 putative cofD-like protein [Aureibacillus halotolerans]
MNTETRLPRVVAIGGGTGLSVLLRGLKVFPVDLTAVVTVADDGGSSGALRHELNIPPPGDIRNVIAAMSEVEPLIEGLFQHRFQGSSLSGHALGNLLLAAMTSLTGDFTTAIAEMSKVLKVKGKILPACNESVALKAMMEDGSMVEGESAIAREGKRIHRLFYDRQDVQPLPDTLQAIEEADLIVIGPGSLYTSIMPNLIVPGVSEAIEKASAQKVYVCNVMTQFGETTGYTASDHLRAIVNHMNNNSINTIIVNEEMVPAVSLQKYAEEDAVPVMFDEALLTSMGVQLIKGNFIDITSGMVRHDTTQIAGILYDLASKGAKEQYQRQN